MRLLQLQTMIQLWLLDEQEPARNVYIMPCSCPVARSVTLLLQISLDVHCPKKTRISVALREATVRRVT